ncbi:hypothetical protein CCC_00144 [Paramagnetospirillum magnetotacticum MS-1]|uniref:DUF3035 domain-containing protein n=1 Tax=Paramagnetospirillum magnetotacticum MS-1 TaxID=272627 RepID=A0A0C2YPN8_PARME|nr:DUF3035 domain-containing protein [Paramagnetospirillum magnetotacticum]KIL97083.1 hypothetical protein CCC_00144 [Paramagnetospirillum magnetotacticum MS-1]
MKTYRRTTARLIALAALLAPVVLSACTDVKRSLGYEKAPPDEFQVVQRAPLAMPPEFSLRPPQPGAVRPQEGVTRDQARQILVGGRMATPISTEGRTGGDIALMKRVGADSIQPDIRVLVNKETQALADADKSFQDRIMFWRKAEPPGSAVDASKETQRLRENQALGKSVSEGETPQVQRRKRAWLEGIFN